ncbi:MAG: amylo-alpha-1,6-glucosidase [Bryobacterales bacterium]|nr:amylo-alpha-1,6-glucosidase [Bryobacterales bacterium]
MEPIVIDGERCRDWTRSSELEWLETNAAGGFAMGTVAGANTRRYHGLLAASLRPPVERYMLLSRLEEKILCDGERHNLGAAQFPGVIAPSGFRLLEEFRLDPFPVWSYRAGCACVEKRLFLVQGEQTAVVQYHVSNKAGLSVRPFLAYRDYHSLQHAGEGFHRQVEDRGSMLLAQPYEGLPALRLFHNGAGFISEGNWYYRNEYRKEMERGLDFQEDTYSPGWIHFDLLPGEMAYLVATIENHSSIDCRKVRRWEASEQERRTAIAAKARTEFEARLNLAADQFLVHRANGSPTVIAGYPWFTDWGRDTMISLPGLLITRGRPGEAEDIIKGFLQAMDQGVIPNRFPDAGEKPEYNTADATLWMFPAVWALQQAGFSGKFLRETFYPAAKEILQWHTRGTHYGIGVDAGDGLLRAGAEGTQLTWMDAKTGNWVVTPRHGKPVEINALWYNALRMMARWASEFGELRYAAELKMEAARVQSSFEAKFWNPKRRCLYDRLAPQGPDERLRPNQIFAISLPFPLMSEDQRQSILERVEETLLTPAGLRTLAPGEPDYRGRYEGGPRERDGAYHQGTVWPWLLGPFLEARLRVFGSTADNLSFCRRLLQGMEVELQRCCLGSLPEIYDGDAPHRPKGAVAQAWSVAELLRMIPLLAGR